MTFNVNTKSCPASGSGISELSPKCGASGGRGREREGIKGRKRKEDTGWERRKTKIKPSQKQTNRPQLMYNND